MRVEEIKTISETGFDFETYHDFQVFMINTRKS